MAPLCNEDDHIVIYTGEEVSSTTINLNPSNLASSNTREETLPLTIKPAARCSVSFSPSAAIHVDAVMNIDDYSQSEKYECWYQVAEMMEIRREVKETVALMNRNVPMDDITRISAEMNASGLGVTTITTYGLEGKTKIGKRHRKEIRLASLAAVFDEQTLQEMDGFCDPIMIARAYAEYTYPTQVAAFQRAALHQKEAAAIHRKDHQKSLLNEELPSAETSSGIVAQSTLESTKSAEGSQASVKEEEEREEVALERKPFSLSNDIPASSELVTHTMNNNNENIENNVEIVANDDDVNAPYYNGPLRIRDRFACLLPRSSSNSTRSLMGAFRVVQI